LITLLCRHIVLAPELQKSPLRFLTEQGRISPPWNREISRWALAQLQNFEAANQCK